MLTAGEFPEKENGSSLILKMAFNELTTKDVDA